MQAATSERRYVILGVCDDSSHCRSLVAELEPFADAGVEIGVFGAAEDLLAHLDRLDERNVTVPLIVLDGPLKVAMMQLLASLRRRRISGDSRLLLVESDAGEGNGHTGGEWRIDLRLRRPLAERQIAAAARTLLTDYLIRHDPPQIARFVSLLDVGHLSEAFIAADQTRRALRAQLRSMQRSFLTLMDVEDREVEAAMIREIDQALAGPPRQRLPAGSVLLEENQPTHTLWILLEGRVQLSRRADQREIVFHSASAGRIIGLLALAQRGQAFYTCRALTDVSVIPLTWRQLDEAFGRMPSLSIHFITVLIRTLANRIRKIVGLQMRVDALNEDLAAERDHLADAIDQLKRAQTRLVESEKMATLGQLVAGIAHELNNPITAIHRSADHALENIDQLLAHLDEDETIRSVIAAAMQRPPLSTREQRRRRDELAAALGDEHLARRLLKVGIEDAGQYRTTLASLPAAQRQRRLMRMEHAHHLGTALRNIRSGSQRVTAIIQSLRSYARSDRDGIAQVNVHTGLEETLLLFGPRLKDVKVIRQYDQAALVQCHPGELNQVWTNLIANALDAMNDRGTLTIATDRPDQRTVRVRITDSGPGIAPEHRERIFDPNFTTKHGGAEFGLGIGLAICREIVTRHGGQITIDSEPGRTTAVVVLPAQRCETGDPS